MFFKSKKFLIVGVSLSGAAAVEFLLSRGALVYLYDDAQRAEMGRYSDLGAIDVSGRSAPQALSGIYCVIVSPGVSPRHRMLQLARQKGISVIGEMELGSMKYAGTVMAITGTNGKSTVTSLLHHILKAAGEISYLCGNIGIPISCYADGPHSSVCCCEVSSFQLEYTQDFRPHISAVLNIGSDHLDRHRTLANYIEAKKRIYINQRKTEYTVLNFDCPYCRTFFEDAHSDVYWFSLRQKVKGAYIENGKIMFDGIFICDVSALLIPGVHNVANCLAAVAMASIYGVSPAAIAAGISTFKGINHRLSYCGNALGVDYYNDSKATNIDSAIAAIDAIDKRTVIILGGSTKRGTYRGLIDHIMSGSKIKYAVCYGQAGKKIYQTANKMGAENFKYIEEFEQCVLTANSLCSDGDVLLLSPACASYDQFLNFEQRGEKFCSVIERIRAVANK